jgi:tetratricopeptide (TPR) repeat protein
MKSLARAIILTTLVATSSGPAYADPFDHQWCRYPTARYDFISDLSQSKVMELAEQMEVFRQSVQPFIHGDHEFEELQIKVVIFRDADDFASVLATPHFSGFMQPSLRQNLLVISPGQENRWLTENTLHEYTHYLLRNRLDVRIPTWYDEGLASLLSTAAIGRRDVTLGKAPKRLIRKALRGEALSLQQVLDTEVLFELDLPELNDLYLTSWALMHYISLGTHQTKQLESYLRSTDAGLNEALGTTNEELDAQLSKYLQRARLPRIQLPKPAIHLEPVEAQCLTDIERDRELAMLMLYHKETAALALLQQLHEQEPENVDLLLSLSRAYARLDNSNEALQFAELAHSLDRDHPGAKISVALNLTQSCMFKRVGGCNAKWRRAAELLESGLRQAPQRFDAELGLGVAYLHRNSPEEAVTHLRRAYERAPWAPHINLYLGECYRLLGDPRARGLLTNALNWATMDLTKRLATSALSQLNEVDE